MKKLNQYAGSVALILMMTLLFTAAALQPVFADVYVPTPLDLARELLPQIAICVLVVVVIVVVVIAMKKRK